VTTEEDELQLRLRQDYSAPGLIEVQSVVVKSGPQAWKTAAVLTFGDKSTGVVSNRTLRVQTWKRGVGGFGFEYKPDFRWSCDDDEIKRLSALLITELPAAGTYTLVDEASTAEQVAGVFERARRSTTWRTGSSGRRRAKQRYILRSGSLGHAEPATPTCGAATGAGASTTRSEPATRCPTSPGTRPA